MSAARIVEQHIAAFNSRNHADEPWADDASLEAPGGARVHGRANVLGFLETFHIAFSDGRLKIVTLLEDGHRAAAEGIFEGTHDGPLASPTGDEPPTGRAIRFRWAAVYETGDGRLRSEHLFFDEADFLAQLGFA